MTTVWPVIVSVRHIATTMSAQASLSAGFLSDELAAELWNCSGAQIGGRGCLRADRGYQIVCVGRSREMLYVVEGITDHGQAISDEVIEGLLQGYSSAQDLPVEEGLSEELRKRLLERALAPR
jgi:hypothetical protein